MKKNTNPKSKPFPNASDRPAGEPTTEEIAAAAYSIWEQEGRPAGRDVEHWLKAESLVRQNRSSTDAGNR